MVGIAEESFVANWMRFLAVKKLWKLGNIWQSYNQNKSGMFLWLTVYIRMNHSHMWLNDRTMQAGMYDLLENYNFCCFKVMTYTVYIIQTVMKLSVILCLYYVICLTDQMQDSSLAEFTIMQVSCASPCWQIKPLCQLKPSGFSVICCFYLSC